MASFFTPIQGNSTPYKSEEGEEGEEGNVRRRLFEETPPPPRRRFGAIKTLNLSSNQKEDEKYNIPNEYETYRSSKLTKNILQNRGRRVENHSVDDLYEEFVSVLTDPSFEFEEITKESASSSSANIKVGVFGNIVIIQRDRKPEFVIKRIDKRYDITLNRKDVDVEIENIQYINQHMSDTHVIKHVILRDGGTYYFISKYLQGYITLYDYVERLAKSNINISGKRDRIRAILQNIKSAMNEMYNVGIVHNDAHLQNIKINPNTLEIKILDYGICSILGRRERPDMPPEMTNQERVKQGVKEGVRRGESLESGATRYYITINQERFDDMYHIAMNKVLGTTLSLMIHKNLRNKNVLTNRLIHEQIQTFFGNTPENTISFYDEYVRIPGRVEARFRREDGVVERKIQKKVQKIQQKIRAN